MNQKSILKLLKLASKYDITGSLLWDEDLNFAINCSDSFFYATADAEEIKTNEDIDLLEECLKEMGHHGDLLYCYRKRKLPVLNWLKKYIDEEDWDKFEFTRIIL
jgi:hypothetical protein